MMSDVLPEQKQYQYENEYPNKPHDDAHLPNAVGVYDRPNDSGLSPTIVAIAAVVILVLLAAVIMLLLI